MMIDIAIKRKNPFWVSCLIFSDTSFNPIQLSPKWQTIVASLVPAGKAPPTCSQWLTLDDGDQMRLDFSLVSQGKPILAVLFHGLCGCSESSYMIRLARKLHAQGISVVRVNHRGATPALLPYAKGIYHAGKSADVIAVLHHLQHQYADYMIVPIGFSISGNMLLKALGEMGECGIASLSQAYAVCPAVDLTSSAQRLQAPENAVFQRYFVGKIKKMIYQRYDHHPDLGDSPRVDNIKTLYDLDHVYAAKEAGHHHVDDYYRYESSLPLLSKIKVPTTILADLDDPFIANDSLKSIECPFINTHLTEGGGHMGYLGSAQGLYWYHFWMDDYLVRSLTTLNSDNPQR